MAVATMPLLGKSCVVAEFHSHVIYLQPPANFPTDFTCRKLSMKVTNGDNMTQEAAELSWLLGTKLQPYDYGDVERATTMRNKHTSHHNFGG